MSLVLEEKEISALVNRLLDNLSLTVESQTGRAGIVVRQKIGDLRASFMDRLADETFAAELLACFTAAREANARLAAFGNVREALFVDAEASPGDVCSAIIQTGIGFCLSAEAQLATAVEFNSRDDVDEMIKRMKDAFDTARELAADAYDSFTYQQLTYLAGAVTAHLASVARPLPRMVTFKMAEMMPALSLGNRLYYDTSRWEEIVQENKVVHPAFCPRELRGLAS